jgi:hypothetical protein
MTSTLRLVAATFALALTLWLAPSTASAQPSGSWTDATTSAFSRGPNLGGVAQFILLVPYTAFSAASLALSVADLISYGLESPWSDGVAVLDFVGAGLNLLAGSLVFFITDDPGWQGMGAAHFGVSAHLLAHGIWSLATNDPPPLAVAVGPDGASIRYEQRF